MPKTRKSPKNPRTKSFHQQNGRCYYCDQPMWVADLTEFVIKYKITLGQAKGLQCTGEHLIAHSDGGTCKQDNIVAACLCCNQGRHRRKINLNPKQFKSLIQRRMNQGRWHNFRLASVH